MHEESQQATPDSKNPEAVGDLEPREEPIGDPEAVKGGMSSIEKKRNDTDAAIVGKIG
ncbi:MAG: hypothetical protein ACREBE_21330 [bacterium]